MPFKYYHGKTGRVWNVTKRALGVEMNKKVGGRIMKKRLHVRIEHVRPSRCREEFLLRRERNDKAKKAAKGKGGACQRVPRPQTRGSWAPRRACRSFRRRRGRGDTLEGRDRSIVRLTEHPPPPYF